MVNKHRDQEAGSLSRAPFATTHWSLVVAAGRVGTAQSHEALAALCAAYWYPLYAFVRRSGYPAADAEDLTQAFFARMVEKNDVAAADRQRGRFRSFLLGAMKHFLANQRDRAMTLKRGGGRRHVSFDFDSGEKRYQHEPSHDLTAERLFDQQWAVALLERVLTDLRLRYTTAGKGRLFDHLKGRLAGARDRPAYAEIAKACDMTEDAVKVAAHRLRRRYRERLRQEIAQTVNSPEEVDDEIRDLFGAFGA